MKKASITEAKNNFSALIDRVKAGGRVLIVDRGHPVARLEPVNQLDAADEDRLARLVRAGIVRPARGNLARTVLTTAPPRPKRGVSGVRVLLDERSEGR
jgi:prevent-host-death family protein